MNKLVIFLVATTVFIGSFAQAWAPEPDDALELSVAQAILRAKGKDPTLTKWFESAYAYAVFPKIGKGAVIVGGAHGKGLVIHNDETVGYTSMTQITIGGQLGGQAYSEFIMFRDKTAFDHFTRGNFQMSAQVSAVALTAGASADANYNGGVAVFTISRGGFMFEASVGGQKFKYEAK